LGNKYLIEASVGHVRDLPKKTLGIDLENQYQPVYEISADKKKVVANLKKLAKMADKIYLATDPDREGEAIAWHIQFLLQDAKT
jgi:DNA topoisomerase-1